MVAVFALILSVFTLAFALECIKDMRDLES